MTHEELLTLGTKLQNLFPRADWNDDLLAMWTKQLCGFGFDDALAAVERHRRENKNNSPHLDTVLFHLGRERQKRVVANRQSERIVDWLRLQDKFNGGRYMGMANDHVLTDHFASAWQRLRDNDKLDDGSKQRVRSMIFRDCITAFMEIQFPRADAEEMARCCVELGPGERISAPRVFGQVPGLVV